MQPDSPAKVNHTNENAYNHPKDTPTTGKSVIMSALKEINADSESKVEKLKPESLLSNKSMTLGNNSSLYIISRNVHFKFS